jgi:hypothetical protein
MDVLAVLRRREERWHRVDVGREDHDRLSPGGEHIEAVVHDGHALDGAARPSGEILQIPEKEVADLPFAAGRRVDVDQGAGQGEEVHGDGGRRKELLRSARG